MYANYVPQVKLIVSDLDRCINFIPGQSCCVGGNGHCCTVQILLSLCGPRWEVKESEKKLIGTRRNQFFPALLQLVLLKSIFDLNQKVDKAHFSISNLK